VGLTLREYYNIFPKRLRLGNNSCNPNFVWGKERTPSGEERAPREPCVNSVSTRNHLQTAWKAIPVPIRLYVNVRVF
jgi:hypothetical protein